MYLKGLRSKLSEQVVGSEVKSQISYYGSSIVETTDGKIFIDQQETKLGSLEEAKQEIKQQMMFEEIQHELQQELYADISPTKVADIIRKTYEDVRVTDTLVESYIELASSKLFTTDPIAQEIRKFNNFDRLLEGHVDYKLDDGSTVVISEETQQHINNTFGQHTDVVQYMRESKENFLSVLNQLEG
jgi:hypothetical protein